MQWSPPPRPPLTPDMRPITGGVVQENPGRYREVISARLDPAHPDYHARLQAPEPDGAPAAPPADAPAQAGYAPASAGSPVDRRVVISFGPQAGHLILAIEQGPDWDVADGQVWVVPQDHVRTMFPVLKALGRVKDMTGGAWNVQLILGGDTHGT